jgi:DNA-binding response OmpR family regulator
VEKTVFDPTEASPAKVLVVDDAPPNVKLLRLILQEAGYPVVEAYSGAEALEKLRAERPGAMILDVRMPGMSGYEVCRRVRQDPEFSALPVIMVTALAAPEERVRGIEAGATDFISKPFNKKELLARLETSLAMARAGGRSLGPLPGALVLARADWTIWTATTDAAALLGVPPESLASAHLRQLLEERGAPLPPDESELSGTVWTGSLEGVPPQGRLQARLSPVTGPTGEVVLRVLALQAPGA